MTLIATLRSSAMSCARYTVAIPPRPSSPSTSYSPSVASRSIWSRASARIADSGESTRTVVTPPCGEEISKPQLAQKCAPGAMTAPQRVQVRV